MYSQGQICSHLTSTGSSFPFRFELTEGTSECYSKVCIWAEGLKKKGQRRLDTPSVGSLVLRLLVQRNEVCDSLLLMFAQLAYLDLSHLITQSMENLFLIS